MGEKSVGIFKQLNRLLYGDSGRSSVFKECKDNLNFVQRLELVSKLNVHSGCVNTTCWNDSGTVLLSGSDDQHLVVTDPYTQEVLTSVHTGHRANIFCARFLPCTSDNEVVSCSGDGKICYTNLEYGSTTGAHIFDCHISTTYKVVVVPGDPHTFLSCGEDGTVRWFDLRTKTSCVNDDCKEDVLIKCGRAASALCVNPVSPWQLATGCADSSIRVYDRRMLSTPGSGVDTDKSLHSLLHCFSAPGLENKNKRITCLMYHPTGQELLASYSSESVYLFNMQKEEDSKVFNVEEKPQEIGEEVVKHSEPEDPNLLHVEEGESSRQSVGIQRLRLRGDWSDTGPNARPERERDTQREENPASSIMQRMSAMLTRWLDARVREAAEERNPDENEESPPVTENPENVNQDQSSFGDSLDNTGDERLLRQNSPENVIEDVSRNEALTIGENHDISNQGSVPHKETENVETNTDRSSAENLIAEISTVNEDSLGEPSKSHNEENSVLFKEGADVESDGEISDSTNNESFMKDRKCQSESPEGQIDGQKPKVYDDTVKLGSETETSEIIEGVEYEEIDAEMGLGEKEGFVGAKTQNSEAFTHQISGTIGEKTHLYSEPIVSGYKSDLVPSTGTSAEECPTDIKKKAESQDPSTGEINNSGTVVTKSNQNNHDLECPSSQLLGGMQEICDKSEHLDISESGLPSVPQIVVQSDIDSAAASSSLTSSGNDYEQKGARPKVGKMSFTWKKSNSKVKECQTKHSGGVSSAGYQLEEKQNRRESQAVVNDSSGAQNNISIKPSEDRGESHDLDSHEGSKLGGASNQCERTGNDGKNPGKPGAIVFVTSEDFDQGPCLDGGEEDIVGDSVKETVAMASTSSSQNEGATEDMETALSEPQVAMLKDDLKLSSDDDSGSSDELDLFNSNSEDETSLEYGFTAARSPSRNMARTMAAKRLQNVFRRRKQEKAERAEQARLHKMQLPIPKVERSFSGHRNARTMIKEVNFWGDRYVLSGSDCGHVFIWDKLTGHLVNLLEGDRHVVNCVQPHPYEPILATSGIDYNIKLWAPTSKDFTFDQEAAAKVIDRNELMLAETRDTVTVPASFMLRLIASIQRVERARNQDTADDD